MASLLTLGTTIRYKNYAERYADPARDPFKGNYAGVMTHFKAPVTGTETTRAASKLNKSVWDALEAQPHAYLVLSSDPARSEAPPLVYVLHRPSQLAAPLGTGGENAQYVFVGDTARCHTPTTVYWPEEPFKKTITINVPNNALLDTAFADDASIRAVGPYMDGQPGLEMVCTRSLMFLPPKYISAALAHSPMTPRQAWEIIGGSIRTDPNAERLVVDLKPLLDWIKVACTAQPVPGVAQETNMGFPVPVFPHPDGFHEHVDQILDREVPGWRGDFPAPVGVEQVAVAVNNLTDHLRESQEESQRRSQDAVEKTPAKYWGDATLIANRITWTSTPEELPKLYHIIAKSNKTNQRLLIAEHLRTTAQMMGMEGAAPIVTPSLAKKLATLKFSHQDIDNLDEGIHPFVVGVRTKQDHATLDKYITYYDTMVEGGMAAGLRDLQTLSEKDKAVIPRTLLQASTTLQSFHVLLRAMLPEDHGLVLEYTRFHGALNRKLAYLEELGSALMPAQIVRYVQIRISNWFTEQEETSIRVHPPPLSELLQRIQNRDSAWIPSLPSGASPDDKKGNPKKDNERTPAETKPPDKDKVKKDPATGKGERVNNTNYDDSFTFYKSKGVPLKKLREDAVAANHPVPIGIQGEMCLSYHILGFCWSNCARQTGHQTLAAGDKAKLQNWCREVYV
jgi:hypothetical protein